MNLLLLQIFAVFLQLAKAILSAGLDECSELFLSEPCFMQLLLQPYGKRGAHRNCSFQLLLILVLVLLAEARRCTKILKRVAPLPILSIL